MIEPDGPREQELSDACALIAMTIVRTVGNGDVRVMSVQDRAAAEADRVASILARDRIEAAEERARQAAQLELADGLTVNVADIVVPPTPEWLAKGETRKVAVGGERWTEKPLSTVRRIVTSYPRRALNAGKMNARQVAACDWYEKTYEKTGLRGMYKSWQASQTFVMGGSNAHFRFSNIQLDAQDAIRNAQLLIPHSCRKFFDLVVLEDMSPSRARRLASCHRDPIQTLRIAADAVADFVEHVLNENLR